MRFDGTQYPRRADHLFGDWSIGQQAKWRLRQREAGLCRYCTRPVAEGDASRCELHRMRQRMRYAADADRIGRQRATAYRKKWYKTLQAKCEAALAKGDAHKVAAWLIGDVGHAEAAARRRARQLRGLRLLWKKNPAAAAAKLIG